jgi:hypothetical protein
VSEVIEGTYFAWTRGLKSLVPTVFHRGYPKTLEKDILWKIRITEQEAKLPLTKLVEKYPLENIGDLT